MHTVYKNIYINVSKIYFVSLGKLMDRLLQLFTVFLVLVKYLLVHSLHTIQKKKIQNKYIYIHTQNCMYYTYINCLSFSYIHI